MAYQARPRYQARIERRRAPRGQDVPPQGSAAQHATAVEERPRDVPRRAAPGWNPAPVLDPLVELYRR